MVVKIHAAIWAKTHALVYTHRYYPGETSKPMGITAPASIGMWEG